MLGQHRLIGLLSSDKLIRLQKKYIWVKVKPKRSVILLFLKMSLE